MIEVVNVMGKLYVTQEEIDLFLTRARAGEFAKSVKPPRNRRA
jgi:hypothetical protein